MVHPVLARLSLSLFLLGGLCFTGRAQLPITHAGLGTLSCVGPMSVGVASVTTIASGSASPGTSGPVPAGATVVVAANVNTATNTSFSSLTDNAGNTYIPVQPSALPTNINAALFYNVGVSAMPSGTTFTAVTFPANNWNFKGAWISCTTGPLDASITLNQSTANNGITLTASGLPNSNDTAFAYVYPSSSGGTISTGTNGVWTDLYKNTFNDIAWQNGTSTTITYNPTWTTSSVSSSVLLAFAQTPCSTYNTLALRLDGTQKVGALSNLICNGVTHGWLAKLDALYIGYIGSTSNATKNLVQNAFNLTAHGTISFNGNNGWTGDGSTGYFSTGFGPSGAGGQFALNSASLGVCIQTTQNSASAIVQLGSSDGTGSSYLALYNTTTFLTALNQASGNTATVTGTQGAWYSSRTGSASYTTYLNGGSPTTISTVSSAISASAFTLLADNNGGSIIDFSNDHLSYAFFGGGLLSGDITNIFNDNHTYLQSVGAPSGC